MQYHKMYYLVLVAVKTLQATSERWYRIYLCPLRAWLSIRAESSREKEGRERAEVKWLQKGMK